MRRCCLGLICFMICVGIAAKEPAQTHKTPKAANCQKDPTNPKCMKVWDILQSLS